MLIQTTNDTYSALSAVHSVLREVVYRDLGSELSDVDFEVVAEFEVLNPSSSARWADGKRFSKA